MLRILLVEDNARLIEELSSTLEELAQAKVVGTAKAEDEACLWMDMRTQACDVAIIDVFLKRGSGLGVLEHVASYERPPRRVVLTNYATPEMHRRCRDLGADAVFDKSTEIEQLVGWLCAAETRH
ncbi:MAG: response regulator transcription factor [Rhizobacter sp.]|nr:response regulator transcription factor [Rhizobacter sp.]